MAHKVKKIDDTQIELSITVSAADYEKHLEKAANRIAENINIKGFRKGKAPYDLIKREVGDMAILQEAAEDIVQEAYANVVIDEKLNIIGAPRITIEKMAPDNDFSFQAVVALIPEVTLPDFSKIKVKKEVKKITDDAVTETIDALRGMKAVEITKDGKATDKDKLIIDMNMLVDKVPVEGGQSKDYQVYLSEKHYIPGFNKELVGLKKGDKKEFSLEFPEDHYQKMLAGKKVDFEITVKEVQERKLPELDAEFAKQLGKDTVEELTALIRSNMEHEAEHKAEEKLEIELLEKIVDKAKVQKIPDVLVDNERQRIFHELKNNLDRQGISIKQYLEDIKKREEDLYNDFKEQAERRAKAALVSRQVAKENEDVQPTKEELEKELDLLRATYKDNKEYLERIERRDVQEAVMTQIQNKKVVEWLKAKVLGDDYKKHDCASHAH